MSFEIGGKQPASEKRENQEHLPTIPVSDFFSIELTGGAYRGFVDAKSTEKQYHDFVADRRAFWDPSRGKTILISVETSALSRDGLRSYEMRFTKSSVTGEVLSEVSYVLRPATSICTPDALREAALKLHGALRRIVDAQQAEVDNELIRATVQTQTDAVIAATEQERAVEGNQALDRCKMDPHPLS